MEENKEWKINERSTQEMKRYTKGYRVLLDLGDPISPEIDIWGFGLDKEQTMEIANKILKALNE